MSRLLRTSLRRPPFARPFTSTSKRWAPRAKANCWSLAEIEPTLFQPDTKLRLAWSVAKLLQKHLSDVEEPFQPNDVLTLTADCASLFYPSHVPSTLTVKERLDLIHSKKLFSLPRMERYLTTKEQFSSSSLPSPAYTTLDDIAKKICKQLSVPHARVKKMFPDACDAAWYDESDEPAKLRLTVDEESDKDEVAGVVAVVAYAQWMNQVEWELEVGDETCGTGDFGDYDDEFPQVHPLVCRLVE